MDAFSDPAVEEVVVVASSQVGKTEILNNVSGYFMDQDPAPILMVLPDLGMAEEHSKARLAPMIRDTPCLRGKVQDPRARDSGNTTLTKTFPGGRIAMVGANAPASLASRPIRVVLQDEIDRFPPSAGSEGNPCDLADKRTTTFWNRKKGKFSTPTVEGASPIMDRFEKSDRRRYWVPCWKCGEMQLIVWAGFTWDDDKPETAQYNCQHCGVGWNDAQRSTAVRYGQWRPEGKFTGTAGFHIWEGYSPWVKAETLAQNFLKAKAGTVENLKTFVNTSLGETWKEKGESPAWLPIYRRAQVENLPHGKVQIGGLFLTAGADVQKDRIEISWYAWGRNRESWLVDHQVIPGDPERLETWTKVDAAVNASYIHEGGRPMSALRFCIDSGYSTNAVYAWARKQGAGRVMVVKGVSGGGAPLGQPSATDVTLEGKRLKRGIQVWPVSGAILKPQLYGWLKLEMPTNPEESFPAGYCHFPQMDEEFFKQLTAEELVTHKDRNGYRKSEWTKMRDRNEVLDCRIYATAGAINLGIERFTEKNWRNLEEMLISAKELPPVATPEQPAPQFIVSGSVTQPAKTVAPKPTSTPYYQPVRSRFMSR